MQIIVLGAGFGGLELSATLSSQLGEDADVILIDKREGFVFGFSKLDVMFGKRLPVDVFHTYQGLDRPGLRFVQSVIRSIDPTDEDGPDRSRLLPGRHTGCGSGRRP